MIRKDREVIDKKEIFDILNNCDTIRIAIKGDKYPYVVPVSFGLKVVDDKAVVYFHCANKGLKVDLIKQNPFVAVEGDIFIKTEKTEFGITTRYESVIGFGECHFVTNIEEIKYGLHLLTEHYGYKDYPIDRCKGFDCLLIGKIVLDKIYGKRNLPKI